MKIGILGSGVVAQTLADGFIKYAHEVMLGTHHPEKLAAWKSKRGEVQIGNFQDAAAFGEIIVLAVKGSAASDVLRAAGAQNLAGKIVIDTTNPISDAPPDNGVLRFYTALDDSQMERLQREFLDARFVKAFNSVGSAFMVDPKFADGKPTMFICGNDKMAKEQVTAILHKFSWDTMDMGGVEAARAIEPLCMLWCIPGFLNNEWSHAFKLLR